MMKLTLSLAAMALAGSMAAQSPQISLAADLGLPIGDFGDFASFIVGPSVGFELPVGDKLGVTAQIGYQFVSLKNDNPFIKSYSMIPVQAGLKYYFTEQQLGFYAHGQVGIHASTIKTEDFTILGVTVAGTSDSNTNLSYALGVGYQLEKLDLGLRYNAITPDGDAPDGAKSSSYIGLRIGYLLNL